MLVLTILEHKKQTNKKKYKKLLTLYLFADILGDASER